MTRALIPYRPMSLVPCERETPRSIEEVERLAFEARCAVARVQAIINHAVRQERTYAGR